MFQQDSNDEFYSEGAGTSGNNPGATNVNSSTFQGPLPHYGSQQVPPDGQPSKAYKQ